MRTLCQWAIMIFLVVGWMTPLGAQEVLVIGSTEEAIALLQQDNWWPQRTPDRPLAVPRAMIVAIAERWQKQAPDLPVDVKKDLFFSAMLPLVVHANTMVVDRRDQLLQADATLATGGSLSPEVVAKIQDAAVFLRIATREQADQMTGTADLRKIIKEALYRLDVIPAGLVLGQAAYESGYGTSRFAVKGNALFGQWTYGGQGMVPEQQRKKLGDHRIASFEWPFDSVRSYFINLSAHPAYEAFRKIRANRKAAGKPLDSLALADGLKNYSERGQAYVDTLKGIIRTNRLDVADGAVFRDESMRFFLGAEDPAAADKLRQEIEAMRRSGELDAIVARMRLE